MTTKTSTPKIPVGWICKDLYGGTYTPLGTAEKVALKAADSCVYILTPDRIFEIPAEMVAGVEIPFEPDMTTKMYRAADTAPWLSMVRSLLGVGDCSSLPVPSPLDAFKQVDSIDRLRHMLKLGRPLPAPSDNLVASCALEDIFNACGGDHVLAVLEWTAQYEHLVWGSNVGPKTANCYGNMIHPSQIPALMTILGPNFSKCAVERFNKEFYRLSVLLMQATGQFIITGGALYDCVADEFSSTSIKPHRPGRDVDIYCSGAAAESIIQLVKDMLSPGRAILLVQQYPGIVQILIPGSTLIIQLIYHERPLGAALDFDFTHLMWCIHKGWLNATPSALLALIRGTTTVNSRCPGVPTPARIIKAARRTKLPEALQGLDRAALDSFTAGFVPKSDDLSTKSLASDVEYVYLRDDSLEPKNLAYTANMVRAILGVQEVLTYDGKTVVPISSTGTLGPANKLSRFCKDQRPIGAYVSSLTDFPLATYTGRDVTSEGIVHPVRITLSGTEMSFVPLVWDGFWATLQEYDFHLKGETDLLDRLKVGCVYYLVVPKKNLRVIVSPWKLRSVAEIEIVDAIRCRELEAQ